MRYRGFLASCMLEVAPGVYISPKMNDGVRKRIWKVCEQWFNPCDMASVVMTWHAPSLPGGQGLRILGEAPKEIADQEGILLVRRNLRPGKTSQHSEPIREDQHFRK